VTFLDTHAWLWWLSDPSLLSERARERIASATEFGSLAVASICAWEAAMLVKKGRLELTLAVDDLVSHCEALSFFRFIPLTATIGVKAVDLEPFLSDSADRIIVATTSHCGGTLVTKDERIRRFRKVRTLW
jgi:PIN domain nuclease of toxin-antitoxin system